MQNLGWYVNRLKSMDASEIAWRVRGLFRDQFDMLRLPAGFAPRPAGQNADAFPYPDPGFSCSTITRESFEDHRAQYRDAWRIRLINDADDICVNRLTYFDLERVDHGWPIDWQRDHSAGISGPLKLSILTDYRDFKNQGDCKLVWEPNRHHQLVVLARAWIVTGDRRYPDKIRDLLTAWIDANPFGYGMNWKSTLEHGIRIINWVWALDLIRDYDGLSQEQWQSIHATLYRLIWDAQRRYSRGSSANNHLIGEAAGVFFGCCYLARLGERERWIKESQAILEHEIIQQTFSSGCTREHAFGYQFFVLQFLHQCLLAGRQSGHPFSAAFEERLEAMYRFMHEIVADTGDIPNLNDRDDGYVVNLGETQRQPAALVSAGASLFGDNLRVCESETEFWLSGESPPGSSPERRRDSSAFQDAGYFLLRGGRAAVFVDAAELGYGPIAAHGHADCLSLTLAIDGQQVLVDSGTYDYFSHPELRNYFRSTRAHNTVEIDSKDQSEMLGPFLWGKRASPDVLAVDDNDERATVSARHDGYGELDDSVIHQRDCTLRKHDHALDVLDTVDCRGRHAARIYWHFASGFELLELQDERAIVGNGSLKLEIESSHSGVAAVAPGSDDPLGWISPAYHVRMPSLCLVQHVSVDGPTRIATTLTWQ